MDRCMDRCRDRCVTAARAVVVTNVGALLALYEAIQLNFASNVVLFSHYYSPLLKQCVGAYLDCPTCTSTTGCAWTFSATGAGAGVFGSCYTVIGT